MLTQLFQNITILISSTVLYHFITRNLRGRPNARSIINGLFLGATAILTMLTPFRFSQGIFYDTRSIVIGIAGFFGTPLTAAIATVIAIAFRVSMGGTGMIAGVLSILSAAVISILGRRRRARFKEFSSSHPLSSIWGTWLLGMIIHVLVVLSQFALPEERWHEIIPLMLIPYLGIFPLAFSLSCLLFLDNEHLEKAAAELAESEARYRSLFENYHTIMLISDPAAATILDANPAAEAFYGWDRATLKTMRISDINTLSPDELKPQIERAMSSDGSIFYFKHKRAAAPPIDVEVYSGPITIRGQRLLFSIVHDNSMRVAAERELRALTGTLEEQVRTRTEDLEAQTKKLIELNREYEAFVYSISHDLRAPLRAISGFSTILKDSLEGKAPAELGEETRHMLNRIQANTVRMQNLIDDMLMLSRVSSRALNPQPIDLSALAAEAFRDATETDNERTFDFRVEKHLRATADRDLAQILLANLIGNAIKFTRTREVARIEIGSTLRDGRSVFYVRDNGVGFDVAVAGERLFAPFQRFSEDLSFEGTGIGLSIVKRVVARHGGSVAAESRPSEGTTFYFSFGEERQ